MMPPSSKIKPSNNIFGLNMVRKNGGSVGSDADSKIIMSNNSNPFFNTDVASRAIGPLAIVGGTVSIYTAALSHSSTTLTPLSVVYLLLLALNYSIMPRITKKYVSPKVNKESTALVEEVVKMSMGIGGFILTECTQTATSAANVNRDMMGITALVQNIQKATSNWSIESSILAAGLPSALYAIQGVLTYTSYQHLDSVTFNGLTQIKTLSAALCCYLVLGKMQSKIQIIALGLLSLSTLIFQGMLDEVISKVLSRNKTNHEKKNVNEPKQHDSDALLNIDGKKRFFLGIVPCLAATLLSGLAGAFSQRSLQTIVGSMERNAYFYSAEISFFSALCLVISMVTKKMFSQKSIDNGSSLGVTKKYDKDKAVISLQKKASYFDYWTWQTLVPIFVKATGGILTALVHKHSGSVMKGFSLVLGLVFSALLQTVLDGKNLSLTQLGGTALVLLSSWLHFTNPSM